MHETTQLSCAEWKYINCINELNLQCFEYNQIYIGQIEIFISAQFKNLSFI